MTADTGRSALAWADAWVDRPALERLVLAFGGPARGSAHARGWLEELASFSQRWDFRDGVERDLADGSALDSTHDELILAAASELGLRGSWPPGRAHYDAIVILGGLVTAALARPRFAANLLAGGLTCGRIVALGGHRSLGKKERELTARFMTPDVTDEFHAMNWGVREAFGLGPPERTAGEASDVIGKAWTLWEYRHADGTPVDVAAAPSTEPGVRRANTADTYLWLTDETHVLQPGAHALIVTTQIYCPFQAADAWRMLRLPHDIHVDVVGVVPHEVDPRLEQTFEPHKYLQETRSAILAMLRLYEAASP
jgi:hypothetical protein